MASIPSHEFHDLDDNMMSPEKEFAAMDVDLAQLKQRIPLLEYLQRRNWTGCRVGAQQEFVGLCPLHPDTRPSFYVNARKNLFYCHGCQRGGDLIRFVEISHHLSFRESLAYLQRDIAVVADSELLEKTAAFYRLQLHRHPEAVEYLQQRGLQNPDLIEELGIGYAPGGNLRRHLADLGYSFALLRRTGLINHQGRDAFCRRVMFPCRQQGRVINLYGRSIGTAFPHRLLPRSKGGLFAWESVRAFSTVILVEMWSPTRRSFTTAALLLIVGCTQIASRLPCSQICFSSGRYPACNFTVFSDKSQKTCSSLPTNGYKIIIKSGQS
jgi:DNA primase